MPNFIAPGVYSVVTDQSQYAAPTSTTIIGMVGAAKRGPVLGAYDVASKTYNGPTLITSPSEFVRIFGQPDPNMQGPYAAMLYLQEGNQLWYGRVAGTGSASASLTLAPVTFTALSHGTWGNAIKVAISDSTAGASYKKVTVFEVVKGVDQVREVYEPVSANSNDTNFWNTIMAGSEFVKVSYDESQTTQPANAAATALSGGLDGAAPADSDIVGTQEAGYATGLQAFADPDIISIKLLAAPGYSSPAVVSALATIADTRGDCLALLHGPQGLDAQEIVDWHNATGKFDPSLPPGNGNTPSVQITTHNAALYWPWVKVYDSYNSRDVWVPPVGFAANVIARTDNQADAWWAPAGINRGKLLSAIALEFNATRGQREYMYGPGNGNGVNFILKLPMDGITLYGQRTLQRFASARDRVNVVRLQHYLQDVLTKASRSLVFEQNDAILWDQLKGIVNPFLRDLKGRRAIEEGECFCDATTNTPFRRNNNEVWGYVTYTPIKSAEKIVLNFSINASGATIKAPTA